MASPTFQWKSELLRKLRHNVLLFPEIEVEFEGEGRRLSEKLNVF
jgi:hypothetical protein